MVVLCGYATVENDRYVLWQVVPVVPSGRVPWMLVRNGFEVTIKGSKEVATDCKLVSEHRQPSNFFQTH